MMIPLLRSIVFGGALGVSALALAQPPCGGLIRPAFSYSENGQEVHFIDSSITHNIAVVRSWDMGYAGGEVFDSTDFDHVFPDTLPHTVCLTLTDTAQGQYCQATFCRVVRADVFGICDGLVEPSFATSDGSVNSAQFYNFSTGPGAASRIWEFGDGDTDTSAYASHTYLWPGRYYVALNHIVFDAQDQQYCRSSSERWIGVDGNGATCNQELFANFNAVGSGSGFWTFYGETITSLAQVGTEIWSFGDDAISLGPVTIHQYIDGQPAHQVCMLTAADDGLQDTCYAYVCHTIQEALVGLEDVEAQGTVQVWPTPFTDILHVPLDGNGGVAHLSLMDAIGRIVQRTDVSATEILSWTVSPGPPGVYLLRVEQDHSVRTALTVRQ